VLLSLSGPRVDKIMAATPANFVLLKYMYRHNFNYLIVIHSASSCLKKNEFNSFKRQKSRFLICKKLKRIGSTAIYLTSLSVTHRIFNIK